MTLIAHLSDVHFGAENPVVLEALVVELNGGSFDLIVISGDLTMGARRWEFRAARHFIDRLRAPVLAVPGNHDISPYRLWERFTDPYAGWRAAISEETEPDWRDERVAVVGLNTTRRIGLHWDWSRGRFTNARLRRLLGRFAALPAGLVRVVVAHHPLLPPESGPTATVAFGARHALETLAEAGVSLVLAGHLHRGYTRLAATGSKSPMILQGATATSNRLRGEPNAYNRVHIAVNGQISVDVRTWDGVRWAGDSTDKGAS